MHSFFLFFSYMHSLLIHIPGHYSIYHAFPDPRNDTWFNVCMESAQTSLFRLYHDVEGIRIPLNPDPPNLSCWTQVAGHTHACAIRQVVSIPLLMPIDCCIEWISTRWSLGSDTQGGSSGAKAAPVLRSSFIVN